MARTAGIILSALVIFTAGLITVLSGAMTKYWDILNELGTASTLGGGLSRFPWRLS